MSRQGYAPAGAPARYRAVRALSRQSSRRRRTRSVGDLSYAVYALVLGAAALLPAAWTALRSTGQVLTQTAAPSSAIAVGAAGLAVLAVGGARRAGLLSTTAPEVAFLLRGQFPVRVVLARRAGAAVLVAAGLAATVGLAWSAQAAAGAAALHVAAAGAGGVVVAVASFAGQGSTRPVALGAAACLLLAALLAVVLSAPPALVLLMVLLLGTGALLGAPRVLDGVDPEVLLAGQARWRAVAAGVLSGDERLAGMHLGGRPTRRDGRLLVRWSGVRLVLARDALGLYRTRWRTAVSCAVAVAALLLTATGTAVAAGGATGGLALVVAALVVYGCTGSWVEGLSAHVDNASSTGLTPHSPQQMFWWHAAMPALLAAATAGAAASVTELVGSASTEGVVSALATALLCAASRVWVVSRPLLPLSLLSPLVTPMGDYSVVVVLGWFLRGWFLVAGAVLAGAVGPGGGDGPSLLWSAVGAATAVVLAARTARAW